MNWNCLPPLALILLLMILLSGWARGCNMETKEVGVCLHVYLERDFLSLERIVYPLKNAKRKEIYSYREAPPKLPELDEVWSATQGPEGNVTYGRKGRHQHKFREEGPAWRRRVKRRLPDIFTIIDTYGQHGWVEGPELEDYCRRLGGVITCFEEVLIGCESGYDFFRYRHLLHSLERVYKYLCTSPLDRLTRFLPFLMVIDCAETARLKEKACHRPNVTENVWNQILRLEMGPELCNVQEVQTAAIKGKINILMRATRCNFTQHPTSVSLGERLHQSRVWWYSPGEPLQERLCHISGHLVSSAVASQSSALRHVVI